jgi:hypothetical protein
MISLQRMPMPPPLQADRRTFLRRVYLDLIGLPPKPGEVGALLGDSSPVACEKVVDRLLASPQYGERRGRYWPDVVRNPFSARVTVNRIWGKCIGPKQGLRGVPHRRGENGISGHPNRLRGMSRLARREALGSSSPAGLALPDQGNCSTPPGKRCTSCTSTLR